MAGIGFTLKKLFYKDTFTDRFRAYAFSSMVAAGPWLSAVLVVNLLLLVAEHFIIAPADRYLFMSTIVYGFIFSQLLTAPWQFVISRYISDRLFQKEHDYIQSSFMGLVKIVFTLALVLVVAFYFGTPLPIYYVFMSASLFLILSLVWILMVYMSAAKDYQAIARAFVWGGLVSVALSMVLLAQPIDFPQHLYASNLLLAYVAGLFVTFLLLIRTFFAVFAFSNQLEFDFVRYLNKVGSLFFTGLLYTAAIWIDTILVWNSEHGRIIYDTYRFALLYDHAKFLAFLTIIPTSVLFLVYVETEFYDSFKKYFQAVRSKSTFAEIVAARKSMVQIIYRHIVYLLERQVLTTFTIIVLANPLFVSLGFSVLLVDVFRITALAALCSAIMLVVLLMLLYFEARLEALLVSAVFFVANAVLTATFMPLGSAYLGLGLFLSALMALLLAIWLLAVYLKRLEYTTFTGQPYFAQPEKGLFISLADHLNARN